MLAPLGKLNADSIGADAVETAGDACLACVGPLANRIIEGLSSWCEGAGYTPKAFCDMNTQIFFGVLISLREEA